jgi:Holliday junction resolvase RusA-like endonuclease
MNEIKYDFCLPFPISVNATYRNIQIKSKTGRMIPRTILSKKARLYAEEVKKLILELNLNNRKITDDIQVTYIYYPKTNRSYDCANYDKTLSDSLTKAGLYSDDKIIKDIRQIKGEKSPMSYVRCLIKNYNHESTLEDINNFFNSVEE